MISAQTVTDALEKMGGGGAAAVADHLQAQTYKERSLVRRVLSSLLQAGGVKAVRQEGVVIYHLNNKPNARGAVQAKLWRFACHRFQTTRPFTAAEAAGMAACDRDYTKRYCRWLWNSGYLAIVSRGRAGAMLYQVVGGKANEAAPAWNRRAEKRKNKPEGPQAGTPAPLPPPAAPAAAGIITRNPAITFFDEEIKEQKPRPRERLDAALEDFGRALVDITGSIGRAWEIIREMKGELLAIEGPQAGTPAPLEDNDGTEGHH